MARANYIYCPYNACISYFYIFQKYNVLTSFILTFSCLTFRSQSHFLFWVGRTNSFPATQSAISWWNLCIERGISIGIILILFPICALHMGMLWAASVCIFRYALDIFGVGRAPLCFLLVLFCSPWNWSGCQVLTDIKAGSRLRSSLWDVEEEGEIAHSQSTLSWPSSKWILWPIGLFLFLFSSTGLAPREVKYCSWCQSACGQVLRHAGQKSHATDLSSLCLDFYNSILHYVLSNSNINSKEFTKYELFLTTFFSPKPKWV